MENTDDIMEMCLFCFKNLDNVESLKSEFMSSQDVYDICCRLISKEDLGEYFFKWNNCTPLPFCQDCFLCAKEICLLNTKLEALQGKIDELVEHFTVDFQRRRDENTCNVKNETVSSDIDLPDPDPFVSYEESQANETVGVSDGEATILYPENCAEGERLTIKTEIVHSDNSHEDEKEDSFNANDVFSNDFTLASREPIVKRIGNNVRKVCSKSRNKLEYVKRRHILPRRKAALKAAKLFGTHFKEIGDNGVEELDDDSEEAGDDCQINMFGESSSGSYNDLKLRKIGKRRRRPVKSDLKKKTCSKRSISRNKCKYCKIVFTKLTDLESHISIHNEERPFACPKCGFRFAMQSSVLKHLKKKHFSEKVFKCAHCKNTYKYMHCLKDHVRIQKHHDDTKDFDGECKLCEKAIALGKEKQLKRKIDDELLLNLTETSIKSVKEESSNDDPNNFKFESNFENEEELEAEVETAIKSNLKRRKIKNVEGVQIRPKKLYKCADCDKNCYSKRKLIYHQYSHLPTGTEINCGECSQVFTDVVSLQNHELSSHAKPPKTSRESKVIECTICFKIFSSKGNLNKHMYLHNDEKQFTCPICTKKFSTKSALTAHSVYHKKDRPYLCEECGQGFHTGTKLREHYRVHTGLLLFCEYCPKGFRNSTHLKQHLRVHNKGIQQPTDTKYLEEKEAITLLSFSNQSFVVEMEHANDNLVTECIP